MRLLRGVCKPTESRAPRHTTGVQYIHVERDRVRARCGWGRRPGWVCARRWVEASPVSPAVAASGGPGLLVVSVWLPVPPRSPGHLDLGGRWWPRGAGGARSVRSCLTSLFRVVLPLGGGRHVLIRSSGFMETQVKVPEPGCQQGPSDRRDVTYTRPFERHSLSSALADFI